MTEKARSMTYRRAPWLFGLMLAAAVQLPVCSPANEFIPAPTWELPTGAAISAQIEEYLQSSALSLDQQESVRDAWKSGEDNLDLLDRLANALAASDEAVAELVAVCSQPAKAGALPEFPWLADSETPRLVRHNLRLYLARWLVQQGFYDEALDWTEGLSPTDVVAPDALLFYRAVAQHGMVQPDEADATLTQLLQQEEKLPPRYQKLASLMREDLTTLEDESLDHIARRMDDIRRRLALGRSGEKVQGVEKGVIESLDKLIKQAEDQMKQQQQAQSAGSAGGQPSGTPMQDSRIADLKAPGKVDRRDVGRGDGWGNLPDKDREKAMQQIGREFPSHYREVIEEYFRRLASEESANNP